jgi:hypothetical protein
LQGWFDSYDRVLLDKNVLGAGADILRSVAILHDHHRLGDDFIKYNGKFEPIHT